MTKMMKKVATRAMAETHEERYLRQDREMWGFSAVERLGRKRAELKEAEWVVARLKKDIERLEPEVDGDTSEAFHFLAKKLQPHRRPSLLDGVDWDVVPYEAWCRICGGVTEHLSGECQKCRSAGRGVVEHPERV